MLNEKLYINKTGVSLQYVYVSEVNINVERHSLEEVFACRLGRIIRYTCVYSVMVKAFNMVCSLLCSVRHKVRWG